MKNFIILIFALSFAFATTNIQAQDVETVDFTVELVDVLDLVITAGDAIWFTFDDPVEYNNGIDGDAVGEQTDITCAATSDWELTIATPDLVGIANSDVMTADNVGCYVTSAGTNTFAGGQVTSAYTAYGSPLALTNAATLLIDNGSGNAGDETDNIFTLHWQVGTMGPGMNATSMLQHVALGTLSLDVYNCDITLTLQADTP